MNEQIVYPTEESVTELRKRFRPVIAGYISEGTLQYVLESVKDIFNDMPYEEAFTAKASYLLYKIVTLHPFIDGNKRTAFGTAELLLHYNGYRIDVGAKAGETFVVNGANGLHDEVQVRRWIRQHLKPLGANTR